MRRTGRPFPALWYGLLALLVSAPLMRGGYLVLLDFALVREIRVRWSPTPAMPGPVNNAPAGVVLDLLTSLGYAAGVVLVFAVFFAAGMGMHRAVLRLVRPASAAPAFFAGTLYMVNPFVYERLMAGHVLILSSYALAPFVLVSVDRFLDDPGPRRALAAAAWLTAVTWMSLHAAWMLGVLLAVLVLVRFRSWSRDSARWGAVAVGLVALANLWWIVGVIRVRPGELVSVADVEAFATQPRSNAVVGAVAALYGFWRHEYRLPKDGVALWWVLFVPVVVLVAYGLARALRDARLRPLGATLAVVAVVAVVLAAGTSFSPTRGGFLWLFGHVPSFAMFREPQKWAGLLPLVYGVLGAVGLDGVLAPGGSDIRRRTRAAVALLAVCVPLVYAHTLVWNWDRLRPVRFPSEWAAADRFVRERGGGTMLFLPWHQYLTMSFTRGRVVNPAPAYFSVPVVAGDNLELGPIRTQSQNPESRAVEDALFTAEGRAAFAERLAPLCIRWVALAKEDDHRGYDWLYEAEGLAARFDTPTIALWERAGPPAPGCR